MSYATLGGVSSGGPISPPLGLLCGHKSGCSAPIKLAGQERYRLSPEEWVPWYRLVCISRGYKNQRYLLLKAQRMAVHWTQFVILKKAT
jgi:hypothetical protein